jgi:hypothetical protein
MFTFRIGSKSRIGYRNKLNHIRQFHGSLQKLKLIQEIQKIYKSDNEVWTERGVLPAHIKAMITHINEGYSAFHPILVYKPFQLGQDIGVKDVDAMRRQDKLGYCCLSRKVFNHDDDPYTSVCVPSLPVDSLLFKALANILIREFLWRRNNLPPLCELTHYNEILDYHESFWNDQKDIDRIICVDLSPSIKHVSTSASPVPLIQKSVHLPGKYHASFSVPSQVGGAGETTTTAFATSAEAYASVFVSHLVSISLFPGHFVGTHLRYPYRGPYIVRMPIGNAARVQGRP